MATILADLHRVGRPRVLRSGDVDRLAALAPHMTNDQLAEHFGCSRRTIERRLQEIKAARSAEVHDDGNAIDGLAK